MLLRRVLVPASVERENADRLEAVALADLVVVEVVPRRDLHAAGAELRINIVVFDYWNGSPGERQPDAFAHQTGKSLVLRIDGNGDISEHRFGARGRHRHRPAAVLEGIADLPDLAVLLFGLDLQVGDGGAQLRIPVDEPFAAVNQILLKKSDENFHDGPRHPGVHREIAGFLALGVGVGPVGGRAEAAHLARDGGAGFLLPLPHALDEFLAPEVVAGLALLLELALDPDLGGDAGLVRAARPAGLEAAPAVAPAERVHQRLLERMPHVQG